MGLQAYGMQAVGWPGRGGPRSRPPLIRSQRAVDAKERG
jgi:hypothetical protein